MEHNHEHDARGQCCNSDRYAGLHQSLSEIDYLRGIWYAASNNDSSAVQRMLRSHTPVDAEDSAGYTALHYAARNGSYDVCLLLLQNNAAVNAVTRCGRATALHRAATQDYDSIIELLLRFGADANLKDADGCTALHRALKASAINACHCLVPHTDMTLVNNRGESLEQLAKDMCIDINHLKITKKT